MKKVLTLIGVTAIASGVGIWAVGGWSAIAMTFLVPLFFITASGLLTLGLGYCLVKFAPSFLESVSKGLEETVQTMAA